MATETNPAAALPYDLAPSTALGSLALTYDEDEDAHVTSQPHGSTVDGDSFGFSLTLNGDALDFYAWTTDGRDIHAHGLAPTSTLLDAWTLAA